MGLWGQNSVSTPGAVQLPRPKASRWREGTSHQTELDQQGAPLSLQRTSLPGLGVAPTQLRVVSLEKERADENVKDLEIRPK